MIRRGIESGRNKILELLNYFKQNAHFENVCFYCFLKVTFFKHWTLFYCTYLSGNNGNLSAMCDIYKLNTI